MSESTGGAAMNNRNSGPMKLMLNYGTAVAGGCPHILDTSLYCLEGIAAKTWSYLKRGMAPQKLYLISDLSDTGIWVYRPVQEAKILQLTFLTNTGAAAQTSTFDINLFPKLGDGKTKLFGKRNRLVGTIGALAHANQSTEPFTEAALTGAPVTLRHYASWAYTWRDCGDLQVYDKGFAADQSGTIYVDMSCFDMIAMVLQAKAAASTQELVGIAKEVS